MNPVQQITPTIVTGMGLALAAASVLEGIAEQLRQSRQAIARGDGGAMLTRTIHDLENEAPAFVAALVAALEAPETPDAGPAPTDGAPAEPVAEADPAPAAAETSDAAAEVTEETPAAPALVAEEVPARKSKG